MVVRLRADLQRKELALRAALADLDKVWGGGHGAGGRDGGRMEGASHPWSHTLSHTHGATHTEP